jgi:hypothetical protein
MRLGDVCYESIMDSDGAYIYTNGQGMIKRDSTFGIGNR